MSNVPGMNLLNLAMTVINSQTVTYYKYVSRSLNNVGNYVSVFATGVQMTGSWQPVPRHLYTAMGLNLQKDYFTFYTSNNILDVNRDVSGDQIARNGQRFQCLSDNDWYFEDGWVGVLCVAQGTSV